MVNQLLDAELAPQGIASLVLHPGSVLTRMNSDDSDVKPPGEGSTITPRDSVSGINRYPCTPPSWRKWIETTTGFYPTILKLVELGTFRENLYCNGLVLPYDYASS